MPRDVKSIAQGHTVASDKTDTPGQGAECMLALFTSVSLEYTGEKPTANACVRQRARFQAAGHSCAGGRGGNACESAALTVASSAWECVDGRVWGGSAIAMCVSAGSGMFWSVLINNSLGRRKAGAGQRRSTRGGRRQEEGVCAQG